MSHLFDLPMYKEQAFWHSQTLKKAYPGKIFTLVPLPLPKAKGFYKLQVAVLGASDFSKDHADKLFDGLRDTKYWIEKINDLMGIDEDTARLIAEDVTRRRDLTLNETENDDEPTAAVYLTDGEIKTLIEAAVDAGYNAEDEDVDQELGQGVRKLATALDELHVNVPSFR